MKSAFNSTIYLCVNEGLSTLGTEQKELIRIRLKNRHELALKDVAIAPLTFEQSLVESVGSFVSGIVTTQILENMSRVFGIHIDADSPLSSAIEACMKISHGNACVRLALGRTIRNNSTLPQTKSKMHLEGKF